MKKPISRSQSGFTLVELAIVVVIIGLLLGGVFKGTELIESSKVRKAVNEINGVVAAYYSYQDRYSRLPGDDGPLATLTARGASWATVTLNGDADGQLEVTLAQTFSGAGENAAFWQHLKAASFINGDHTQTGVSALPRNAFGGLIGITTAAYGTLNGTKVCLSQAPGKAAVTLDTQLDDGKPNTGRVRATQGVSGTNTVPGTIATAYSEDNIYTLCIQG